VIAQVDWVANLWWTANARIQCESIKDDKQTLTVPGWSIHLQAQLMLELQLAVGNTHTIAPLPHCAAGVGGDPPGMCVPVCSCMSACEACMDVQVSVCVSWLKGIQQHSPGAQVHEPCG